MRLSLLLACSLLSGCTLFTDEALVDRYTNNFDFKQQKWTRVDVGVKDQLNAVQMVDASTGYIVGDHGVVLKTTDGGATWAAGYPSAMTGQPLTSIAFVSPTQGYVSSGFKLFTTQDGGKTWGVQANFQTDVKDTIARIAFANAGAGYMVGDKHSYQSLDAGKTWQPLELLNVRSFVNTGGEVFAGGGNIYRGKVGAGWTGVLSAERVCSGCSSWLAFTSPTKGWGLISGLDGSHVDGTLAMLRTADGGATWTNLPLQDYKGKSLSAYLGGRSADSVRVLRFTDDQNGWLLFGGGMLSTYDGGQTWVSQHQAFIDLIGQSFSTYMMESFIASWGFNGLDATDSKHVWVVGKEGRVYTYGGQNYPAFHEK